MNKYIPSFNDYLNLSEGIDQFRTAERYRLDNLNWKYDQSSKDELVKSHPSSSNAKVYIAEDKDRNLKYRFETWVKNISYYIVLRENKNIVYNQEYHNEERRYYVQDCKTILGFEIKENQ